MILSVKLIFYKKIYLDEIRFLEEKKLTSWKWSNTTIALINKDNEAK